MKKFFLFFVISFVFTISGIGYSDQKCTDNCNRINNDYKNSINQYKNECNQHLKDCRKKCKPTDKRCNDICQANQRSCDQYLSQKLMISDGNRAKCNQKCNEGNKSKCAGDCSSKAGNCQMITINEQKGCNAAYASCQRNCWKNGGPQEGSCISTCRNNNNQCENNAVKKYNCDVNYNNCKSNCK